MRNKFTLARSCRAAMLAVVVSFSLQAAPVEQKLWRELGRYLRGKIVTVTTKEGKSFSGRDVAVSPDAIVVNNIKVSREAVLSMHWEVRQESETKKLGRQMSAGYRHAGKQLGTSLGPFGLAEFPIITAWGIAATPFCLLGDLFARSQTLSGEVSILPEPGVSK